MHSEASNNLISQLKIWNVNPLIIFDIMKFLERVFAFYINSSLHVSLAVVALVGVTMLEYSLQLPFWFWIFIFFGALTGYNFVKYSKKAGLHHRDLTNSLKSIQIFSLIGFLIFLWAIFHQDFTTLAVTTGFGLLTVLYAIPFFHHKSLRMFRSAKIFVVAVVWAGVTVISPVIANEMHVSGDILLTFFQRIFIVIVLILPFEIRDVPYDAFYLKTLPQQLGNRNTKLFGLSLLILCLVLEFFKSGLSPAYILSLFIFTTLTGWMLLISKTHQTRYFSSFWVEGLSIFWFLVYGLFCQMF